MTAGAHEFEEVRILLELRAGDRILSPTCEIVRIDRALGLAFRSMDEEEKAYFLKYLGSGPEREMRALLKKG